MTWGKKCYTGETTRGMLRGKRSPAGERSKGGMGTRWYGGGEGVAGEPRSGLVTGKGERGVIGAAVCRE